jgi:hypothetical protein
MNKMHSSQEREKIKKNYFFLVLLLLYLRLCEI